jgi:hypothetical protein
MNHGFAMTMALTLATATRRDAAVPDRPPHGGARRAADHGDRRPLPAGSAQRDGST